jgi:hypothetical protein
VPEVRLSFGGPDAYAVVGGLHGSVPPTTRHGTLLLRKHWDADSEWITVIHADPEVRFTDELLTAVVEGFDHPYPRMIRLELLEHTEQECGIQIPCRGTHLRHDDQPCFWGALLHIDARDRHVVYRIGDHEWIRELWLGSWPD